MTDIPTSDFMRAYGEWTEAQRLLHDVAETSRYLEEDARWAQAFRARRAAEHSLAKAPATTWDEIQKRADVLLGLVKETIEAGTTPTDDTLTPMATALVADLERFHP
jgi:hypothetical protein